VINVAHDASAAIYCVAIGDVGNVGPSVFTFGGVNSGSNQSTLEKLSAVTSGKSFIVGDSGSDTTMDKAFDQIAAELDEGWMLGVKPVSSGNSNDWKIEVPSYPSAILKVRQIRRWLLRSPSAGDFLPVCGMARHDEEKMKKYLLISLMLVAWCATTKEALPAQDRHVAIVSCKFYEVPAEQLKNVEEARADGIDVLPPGGNLSIRPGTFHCINASNQTVAVEMREPK